MTDINKPVARPAETLVHLHFIDPHTNGRASQEDWTDKQGNKRTSIKVVVDEIGPTLRFATAKVAKAQNGQQGGNSGGHAARSSAPAQDDPWSTGGASGGYSSEPPF